MYPSHNHLPPQRPDSQPSGAPSPYGYSSSGPEYGSQGIRQLPPPRPLEPQLTPPVWTPTIRPEPPRVELPVPQPARSSEPSTTTPRPQIPSLQSILNPAPRPPSTQQWQSDPALYARPYHPTAHSPLSGPAGAPSRPADSYFPSAYTTSTTPVAGARQFEQSPIDAARHAAPYYPIHSPASPATHGPARSDYGQDSAPFPRSHPAHVDTNVGDAHIRRPAAVSDPLPSGAVFSAEAPHLGSRPPRGASSGPSATSRYLGEAEIEGEGRCHMYDDGTYCKVEIDGEKVNPSWGVTKAGKPRKRLAQACLTCREKKIKCVPGYPKCEQCEKSQRVCKRPDKGQAGPEPANDEATNWSSTSPTIRKLSEAGHITSPAMSTATVGKSTQLSEPRSIFSTGSLSSGKTAITGHSRKRLRSSSPTISWGMVSSSSSSEARKHPCGRPPSTPTGEISGLRAKIMDKIDLAWEIDPAESEPELVMQLLDSYFTHINRATYCMFPKKAFLEWVRTCRSKTQDDRMVLYTLMAMGSVFTMDQDRQKAGEHFASIAAYALEKRHARFSLQLAQSRLLLGFYYWSRGKADVAWDHCGSALRAISALKLNTEEGVENVPDDGPYEYGFQRDTILECRRRTFWSGFLMDRYNGFCGGTLCVLQPADIFLRLPSPESLYESGVANEAPFFDNGVLDETDTALDSDLGAMAYLVQISSIWGAVLAASYRSPHWPEANYSRRYEMEYVRIKKQLDAWHARLPLHLRYTQENTDNSIKQGYVGTFISLHALYHTTAIKLNRHFRPRHLSDATIKRCIAEARQHAIEMLRITQTLNKKGRDRRTGETEFAFSTPFPGYATLTAVDVLTAGGSFASLPKAIETVHGSLAVLQELKTFWASAKHQSKTVTARLQELIALDAFQRSTGRRSPKKSPDTWKLPKSLDSDFSSEDDIVYGAEDELFFSAF